MSKAQVEWEYQKALWERSDKILKDREKENWLTRIVGNVMGRTEHYPMPLPPIDEDYRQPTSRTKRGKL